ncbi:MAG: hypothetical protein DSY82_05100 [Flavobacteriia bacterium]|nr:MAG: hypothetical protein DSY82_05100 [Flavobacteriia bacterium]
MMKIITLLLMFFVASISLQAQTWDFNNSKDGWKNIASTQKTKSDYWELTSKDGVNNPGLKIAAADMTTAPDVTAVHILAITMKNKSATGPNGIRLVMETEGHADAGKKNVDVEISQGDTDYQTYYLDVSSPKWVGTVKEIKILFKNYKNQNFTGTGNEVFDIDKVEMLSSIPTTEKHNFTFDTDGDQEGFVEKNVNSISVAGGILTLDPKVDKYSNIQQVDHHLDASTYGTLEIKLKNNSTDDDTLYFVFPDGSTKELTITTSDTAFKTYKMDLMGNAEWTGEVTGFKIRFGDASRPNPNDATKFGVSSGTGTIEIDKITFTSEVLAVDDVDLVDDAKISLYPNPTCDLLSVHAPKPIEKIEIYNMLGQKAMSKTDSLKTLNISQLEKGIYVLKIYQEGNIVSSKRFIKQ